MFVKSHTLLCVLYNLPYFELPVRSQRRGPYRRLHLTIPHTTSLLQVQQELTLVPMSGQGAIVMEQMLMNVPRGNGPRIRDPPGVVLGDQVVAGILHLDSSSFILNDAAKGGAVTLAGVIANITR